MPQNSSGFHDTAVFRIFSYISDCSFKIPALYIPSLSASRIFTLKSIYWANTISIYIYLFIYIYRYISTHIYLYIWRAFSESILHTSTTQSHSFILPEFYYIYLIYLSLCIHSHMCVQVCVCVFVCAPWSFGGQKTTLGSWFSLSKCVS